MRRGLITLLAGAALAVVACEERQDVGPVEEPGIGGAGPVEEQPDVGPQELPRPVDPLDEEGIQEKGVGEDEEIYEEPGEEPIE